VIIDNAKNGDDNDHDQIVFHENDPKTRRVLHIIQCTRCYRYDQKTKKLRPKGPHYYSRRYHHHNMREMCEYILLYAHTPTTVNRGLFLYIFRHLGIAIPKIEPTSLTKHDVET
jgi:Txe/YoeB family toxin of Txe-Axe toxin-antitoxin module